jgi:hypothetical protein
LVEHQLPKLRVAGSNPVVRFRLVDALGFSARRADRSSPCCATRLRIAAIRDPFCDDDDVVPNQGELVDQILWRRVERPEFCERLLSHGDEHRERCEDSLLVSHRDYIAAPPHRKR